MKYLSLLYIGLMLLAACQHEEMWDVELPSAEKDEPTVSIQFQFALPPDTRVSAQEEIMAEESDVNNLVYAIFQNNYCRKVEAIDLTQSGSLQARGKLSYYNIVNIPKRWLDSSTEIYAVANAPQALRDSLLHGQYKISDSHPLLQKLVAQRIDSLARVDIYNSIIERNYRSNPWPADQKVHTFPIGVFQQPAFFELPPQYRCDNYATFVKNLNDPTLPAAVKNTYERMWIDLQCRIAIYRGNDLNNKINSLTQQENSTHAIRTAFQKDSGLQKYLLWQGKEWKSDLNEQAASHPSKWIEQPVMAGFYKLSDDFPITIVVPVKRIYSRIWFNFQWDGHKETDHMVIDKITVNGLMNKTRLFNLSQDQISNNPADFTKVTHTLQNPLLEVPSSKPVMQPFFAYLQNSGLPYYIGDKPQMTLYEAHPQYQTLAVYPTVQGQIDTSRPPHRCYVYSYQLGGNSFKDNPEIVINYHFTQKSAVAGETGTVIHKKAVARLYDETHHPGKQHHGLLRNYTYQLNCKVTSLSSNMEVQVVAVPWYKIEIDDIPPFE